jgi:hypothetical protein
MKKHWLVEVAKWVDGQYNNECKILNAFPRDIYDEDALISWKTKFVICN